MASMYCIQNKIYCTEKKIHFVPIKTLNMKQPSEHYTQYSSIHKMSNKLHKIHQVIKHKCHINYYICFEVQHTKMLQCKYVVFYHDDAMKGRILWKLIDCRFLL